jgi:CRAL/TRIO domain
MSESVTTSSTNVISIESMDNESSQSTTQKTKRRQLRSLLAALAFETISIPRRKTKKIKNKDYTKHERNVEVTTTNTTKPNNNNSTVYGCTLDFSSHDLFFDAAQSERDLPPDSFESLVISNIVVHRGGYETVLQEKSNGMKCTSKQTGHVAPVDTLLVDNSETETYDDMTDYDESEYNDDNQENVTGIIDSVVGQSTSTTLSENTSLSHHGSMDDANAITLHDCRHPPLPPPPPSELPLRFLRAGRNDPEIGKARYEETLRWRKEEMIDTILREPSPNFALIKQYYPHFCHLRGKNGEPCFYEQPPKTNLKALRQGGVTVPMLLRHYTMVTEYQWQYIIRDDVMRSIYIIDLEGIRFGDFVGEIVDFVKKASKLSAQHYPERAGFVFVINVPTWFKFIWSVVKPIIDETTLEKIYILRGKDEIRSHMQERISIENIPPEYGGSSMPLGESPEEKELAELIDHNNNLSQKGQTLCQHWINCKFCSWKSARSY